MPNSERSDANEQCEVAKQYEASQWLYPRWLCMQVRHCIHGSQSGSGVHRLL